MNETERIAMGEESRKIINNWDLDRFVQGVLEAIKTVKDIQRGFVSPLDRLILSIWKGRYRPV
jgi:hypothetical protein